MAFWDAWFAPRCEGCSEKIVGVAPVEHGGKKLCPTCLEAAQAADRKREAEVEARRVAEEQARAKLEGGKQFGSDPRSRR